MKQLNLNFIKERRLQLGKTMKEMADTLGYENASTYLKYESGVYSIKAEQLPRLAESLECEISDFFTINVAKTAI